MKTLKMVSGGKVLISIFVIFMLSWITLLSSCSTTIRTPRHSRTEVVIQGQARGENQNVRTTQHANTEVVVQGTSGRQTGADRNARRELRQERRQNRDKK
ncbi:MAG TPA: hypothetical protein VF373_08300 [Prolixibacteraceae bacterium]